MNSPELKQPVVIFNRNARITRDIGIYKRGTGCAVLDNGKETLLVSMNADGNRGYIGRHDLEFV